MPTNSKRNLRQRRATSDIERLTGRRADGSKRALLYHELEGHPVIEAMVQAATISNKSLAAAIDQISSLQQATENAQSTADDAGTAAAAAQTTASGAATAAANANTKANDVSANVDEFAANFEAVTVTVDQSSGYVAGFSAVSWAEPDGQGGAVLQLSGDVIALSTISSNRLTVGLGLNWLRNTQFFSGLAPNWTTHDANGAAGAATTLSINDAGQPYAWPSFPTLRANQSNGATTGHFDFTNLPAVDALGNVAPGFAVTEGERVSFSCRMSAHRCAGELLLGWYDGSGALVGTTDGATAVGGTTSTSSAGPAGANTNPDLWDQLWIMADVPSGLNAAYARPIFRKGPSGSGDANSDLFVARPMFSETHKDASAFTPYNPDGTTLIDGGQILADSITAVHANFTSLSALGLSVGSADIGVAVIDSIHLANEIQSDDYAPGVSGWKITMDGAAEFQSVTLREITTNDIQDNAVTAVVQTPGNGSASFAGSHSSWTTWLSITVNENTKPLNIFWETEARGWNDTFGPGGGTVQLRLLKNGLPMGAVQIVTLGENETQLLSFSTSTVGAATFTLEYTGGGGHGVALTNGRLHANWNKK